MKIFSREKTFKRREEGRDLTSRLASDQSKYEKTLSRKGRRSKRKEEERRQKEEEGREQKKKEEKRKKKKRKRRRGRGKEERGRQKEEEGRETEEKGRHLTSSLASDTRPARLCCPRSWRRCSSMSRRETPAPWNSRVSPTQWCGHFHPILKHPESH